MEPLRNWGLFFYCFSEQFEHCNFGMWFSWWLSHQDAAGHRAVSPSFFKEEFINFFLFFCLPSSPKLLRKTCEPRCPGGEVEGGCTTGENNRVLKGKEVKFQIFGVATQPQRWLQLCKSLGVTLNEFPIRCQPEGKKTNVNYIWSHAAESSACGLTSN